MVRSAGRITEESVIYPDRLTSGTIFVNLADPICYILMSQHKQFIITFANI